MEEKVPDPDPVALQQAGRALNFDGVQAPLPPPHTTSFWERRAASEAQIVLLPPATSSPPHAPPLLPVPLEAHQVTLLATNQPTSQAQASQLSTRTSFIIGKRNDARDSGSPQSGFVEGAHSEGGAREADLLSAQVPAPAAQHPPLPQSNSFTYLLTDDQYVKLAEQIPY